MQTTAWRYIALRWFSLCGIVAPPVDAAVNSWVATAQSHYNFLEDYVSDLAASGRPYSKALCILWALFPLLFGPISIAAYAGLREYRFGRITPILLGLFAIFIGLCGIFRYDPTVPEATASSRAHVIVSALASAALFPSPFFLWLATRHDDSWRRLRRFSLLVQAGGIVGALLLALAFLDSITWGGFAERTYWGVYYVWFVVLALKLRRMSRSTCAADRAQE